MGWTYDPSALATSVKDQVRLEIGDTNSGAPLLQDEEIEQTVAVEATMLGAAARCCEIVSRTFLRKADVRVGHGGTMIQYSKAAQQYTDMAAALRKRSSAMHAPWTGGTSKSDKASLAQDPDRVQPIFAKQMEANPLVGGQGSDTPADDGQANA